MGEESRILTTLTNVTIWPAVGTPSVESCVWLVPDTVSDELQSMVHAAAEFFAPHAPHPKAHQMHCLWRAHSKGRDAPARLPRLP